MANKFTDTKGGREGGMNWGIGIDMHTARYKINNKALLHSTGKYIKYLIMNYNEKNMKKNIYLYL